MKRSEFLIEFQKKLDKRWIGNHILHNAEPELKAILEIIEELGMLPPLNKNSIQPPYESESHYWEPQEESSLFNIDSAEYLKWKEQKE